jgi:hypothetical protein
MRSVFTILLVLLCGASSQAQCPDLTLSEIQSIQRNEDTAREGVLSDAGFDLGSETSGTRRYNRCWRSTDAAGKVLYDQALLWNKKTGHCTFLCTDKKAFLRLREQIEGRQGGSTYSLTQSDVYVGQKFKYEFFLQNMDGLEYFAVRIAWK